MESKEMHLLLEASISALASQRVEALKNLCENHRLTVGCSGKRGGKIHKDYIAAILLFRQNAVSQSKPILTKKRAGEIVNAEPSKRQKRVPEEPSQSNRNTTAPSGTSGATANYAPMIRGKLSAKVTEGILRVEKNSALPLIPSLQAGETSDAEPRKHQKRKLEEPSKLDVDAAVMNRDSNAPLLEASRSAVTSQRVEVLKNFCEKHGLTVGCSGKRGGKIHKDYVEAILLFGQNTAPQSMLSVTKKRGGETINAEPSKRQKRVLEESSQSDVTEGILPVGKNSTSQPMLNLHAGEKSDTEQRQRQGELKEVSKLDVNIAVLSGNSKVPEDHSLLHGHGGKVVLAQVAPATVQHKQKQSVQVLPVSLTVRIRLFKRPRDCIHAIETEVQCGTLGELDLEQVQKQLQICRCEIIDPRNNRPFFRYNGNIIHHDDVVNLTENGYLRVVENIKA